MYGTYGDLPFPFHLPIQSRLRKLQGRKPTYADPSSRRWLVRTKLCAIRKMFGNKRSIMKQRQINIQSISHRLLFFFLFFVPWCCFALCHCVLYVFVFGCALWFLIVLIHLVSPASTARHGSHVVDAQALRFSGSKWSFANEMLKVKKNKQWSRKNNRLENKRLRNKRRNI